MFPNLNPMELMVVFGVAVLLFGKKLPEVSRSFGRGILEFKKSFRGLEDDFRSVSESARALTSYTSMDYDYRSVNDTHAVSAPKFQPPSSNPVPRMESEPHPIED